MIKLIKTDLYFIMQNEINDVTKIFVYECICIKLSKSLKYMYVFSIMTNNENFNLKLMF